MKSDKYGEEKIEDGSEPRVSPRETLGSFLLFTGRVFDVIK